MIARSLALATVSALMTLMLGACGEKAQTLDTGAKKSDAPAWSVSNAANPAYMAPGWKSGDQAAWQEQLRKRSQGQNDYAR